jgi:GntR family transcriptional regulator
MYYQIMEQLRGKILNGEFAVGTALPPERELVETYHVSRMTVRQAISELVNEGILVRHQGIGTFVARPKIEQELNQLTSFTQDMERRGMRAGARLLRFEQKPATRSTREALHLEEDEHVFECVRLRLADDEPMALETTSLPASACPGLSEQDLENRSLYALLQERWNIVPFHATQTIEPVSATAYEAEILRVAPGSPMLLMFRTTYDRDGQPFEYVKSVYRGDRYKFIIELYQSSVVASEAPLREYRLAPSS